MSSHDVPKPRLCHIRKTPGSSTGYGFNLHAEKGKSGQYIGKVDEGSPAALAGLKEGDRIIEVNGVNVSNENHQQVVQRIKSVPDETKFLVVDSEADEYYKEKKIVVKGDMDNIITLVTPLDGGSAKCNVRLCHLKVWSDFPGYGFNLHAEKGKSAQFVGKVDEKSPAEAAGLKEKDRIIKVNDEFVLSETHQEVVNRIKKDPKQVKMLVIDTETEEYFKKQNIDLSGDLPDVKIIICPDENPHKEHVDVTLRLCRLKMWSDFAGYGFNLHAEKDKIGQFVGKVDAHSPAEAAGLKEGDRIIKVNGESILHVSHEETVDKIKKDPHQVALLVMDSKAEEHFTKNGLELDSDFPHVIEITCPDKSSHSAVTVQPSPTSNDIEHKLRLCHIISSPTGGFGFNMQSEKGRPGQFIGVVDDDSPAHRAGLKQGDRIIEVNGVNIEGDTHKQAVEKIKAIPNETTLLVVDNDAEKYFKEKSIVMASTLACVVKYDSELTNGTPNHVEEVVELAVKKEVAEEIVDEVKDNREEHKDASPPSYEESKEALEEKVEDIVEDVAEEIADKKENGETIVNGEILEENKEAIAKVAVAAKIADDDDNVADEIAEVVKKVEKEEEDKKKIEATKADLTLKVESPPTPSTDFYSNNNKSPTKAQTPKSPVVISGIEFAASAEEARRKMSKKKTARESTMSMKDKYEMFQKM